MNATETALPLSLDSPVPALRRALLSLYTYLHCALGSLVASQGDLQALQRYFLAHGVFAVFLAGGFALFETPGKGWRRAGATLAFLGAVLSLKFAGWYAVLYGAAAVLLFAESELALRRRSADLRVVAWSLGYGVLPFWAGYLATGRRLGVSAVLLALGFFGFFVGCHRLLHPRPDRQPRRRILSNAVCTGVLLFGMASMVVWLSTYGAGVTGIAVATPGVLWFLWSVTGWNERTDPVWPNPSQRGQAMTACLALELAIALACYM